MDLKHSGGRSSRVGLFACAWPSPNLISLYRCFYASRLHSEQGDPKVEVSLVCRSNYKAIVEKGVTLKTKSFGDYTFTPKHVFASVAEAGKHQEIWDYVVVTTKALPDVSDDSDIVVPLVTRGKSSIVLIQNGVSARYIHHFKVSDLIPGWGGRPLPQEIPRKPHSICGYCHFS